MKKSIVIFAEHEHDVAKADRRREGDKISAERLVGNKPEQFARLCKIYDKKYETTLQTLDVSSVFTESKIVELLADGTLIRKEVEI